MNNQTENFWNGKRVTVMGLGQFGGGTSAVQYLAQRGAILTVTDLQSEKELAKSIDEIADCSIEKFSLGHHDETDFINADFIVVNPAVKPTNRFVELALKNGAKLTTELGLFLDSNIGRVIAVTGTNGKSTTASLIHSILKQTKQKAFLGGNIGKSLLQSLDEISETDFVVLEISSFQLYWLKQAQISIGSEVSTITNLHPNHLDWHCSFDEYWLAKQYLLTQKENSKSVVLNSNDDECWRLQIEGNKIDSQDYELNLDRLQTKAVIHRENLLSAIAVAKTLKITDKKIEQGVREFEPLPHRLETIGTWKKRRFIDDSQATTPESAIYALNSVDEPIVLLAGGKDKGADLNEFANAICENVKAVVLMGETASDLEQRILNSDVLCFKTNSFQESFDLACDLSSEKDVVLLSPGCASNDWFKNYKDRSDQFRQAFERL